MKGATDPALGASNLSCRRGDRLLFRELSFALKAGDALHVTGANGSGKTTLIRVLAGLRAPYIGKVERVGDIGLLDERSALDPDWPLGRALAFWARIDGDAGVDARRLLGLDPLLDVPVRYLSTGQRKRAGLAVLLGRGVPIWLLDEPLSGLDARAIKQVTKLIVEHLRDGGIAVIASHQPLVFDGLRTLAIEDHAPRGEGIEGSRHNDRSSRERSAPCVPTRPPPEGGMA